MAEQGEVLAGRFKLIEPLGKGGMATVWRAEHVELGSSVAVKLIAQDVAASERGLNRFKREAKAAAALTSAHVVQIFDFGVHDDRPYIAMELLEGESLAQRLAREGTISPQLTGRVLIHVARAIHKAHEAGILHRDLKPDNVFITHDDDGQELCKVLDFGVAKVLNSEVIAKIPSHTSTGSLVGSPFYMSPEQIRGHKDIDPRSDLWAIGVIAYECLVGRRPFVGQSLGDLVMSVCSDPMPWPSTKGCDLEGFDDWFGKACARKPDDRFQSAKELARSFSELVGEGIGDELSQDTPALPKTDGASPVTATVPTTPGLARSQDTSAPAPRGGSSQLVKVALVGLALAAILVVAVVTLLPPESPQGAARPAPPPAESESAPPASADQAASAPPTTASTQTPRDEPSSDAGADAALDAR
ncbi:MAG: protein kinase [Deltaproteobacteria bacterium]|jgi:serine/threonine-protein kinase|nr:protein kinase [Deltaproteobacteria bacterium]MBW2533901.1 protein kinase [Deltaproteobacteria bacterium]